jgi:hypothetical protein
MLTHKYILILVTVSNATALTSYVIFARYMTVNYIGSFGRTAAQICMNSDFAGTEIPWDDQGDVYACICFAALYTILLSCHSVRSTCFSTTRCIVASLSVLLSQMLLQMYMFHTQPKRQLLVVIMLMACRWMEASTQIWTTLTCPNIIERTHVCALLRSEYKGKKTY